MLRLLAAGSIGAYQRWLSPYKGFRCAWRAATGRCSCSEYARRLVLKGGLLALWRGLPRQFARCRAACEELRAAAMAEAGKPLPDEGNGRRRRRQREDGSSRWWDHCDPRNALDAVDCLPRSCSPRRVIDAIDCLPNNCDLPCDCSW